MAFQDIGLKLVGPYDLLSGHLKNDKIKKKQSLFLLHWRYYYDPPGFQVKKFHSNALTSCEKSLDAFLCHEMIGQIS